MSLLFPSPTCSRFDLIFLILDPQDELYDRKLARHLVSLYYHQGEEEAEQEFLVCGGGGGGGGGEMGGQAG